MKIIKEYLSFDNFVSILEKLLNCDSISCFSVLNLMMQLYFINENSISTTEINEEKLLYDEKTKMLLKSLVGDESIVSMLHKSLAFNSEYDLNSSKLYPNRIWIGQIIDYNRH